MADVCIVCLGELRDSAEIEQPLPEQRYRDPTSDSLDPLRRCRVGSSTFECAAGESWMVTSPPPSEDGSPGSHHHVNNGADFLHSKDAVIDDEVIAHLLPCGHNLHDSCLRPWVERANSCPICRASFNSVELRNFLNGPAYDSYAVQEKQQQAEIDPSLIIDEGLLEEPEPCSVCGIIDASHETMFCDACDGTVHIFCAGYTSDNAPEVWYCETCATELQATAAERRTAPRPAHPRSRRGRRPGTEPWDMVWASVWRRINLDLDFPYVEDQPANAQPTAAQERELTAWSRRLQVANHQGAGSRFRETASTLLDRRNQAAAHRPESQEELRAWNALDKARTLTGEQVPLVRKRRSATASPASPRDRTDGEQTEPERKLKRPRTRRNQALQDPGPSTIEVPIRPVQTPTEGPSFLTQLLQEVEKQPAPSDAGSPDADAMSGDELPTNTLASPAASPIHSGQASPRALSVTPPPQFARPRPTSPMPLTSIVRPMVSPPFSPVKNGKEDRGRSHRRPQHQGSSPPRDVSPSSPSRNMSYSTKQEVQRMVKAVLAPRYRAQEITKEQYTDINRDVSRMLYERVGDAEGLADQKGREKWQEVAATEVERAISAMQPQDPQEQNPESYSQDV